MSVSSGDTQTMEGHRVICCHLSGEDISVLQGDGTRDPFSVSEDVACTPNRMGNYGCLIFFFMALFFSFLATEHRRFEAILVVKSIIDRFHKAFPRMRDAAITVALRRRRAAVHETARALHARAQKFVSAVVQRCMAAAAASQNRLIIS